MTGFARQTAAFSFRKLQVLNAVHIIFLGPYGQQTMRAKCRTSAGSAEEEYARAAEETNAFAYPSRPLADDPGAHDIASASVA